MSFFSEGMYFDVGPETLKRICEQALFELDMYTVGQEEALIFREKLRFDAFNPVTVELSIDKVGGKTELNLTGTNEGIGPFQEHHVRSKVLELLSRIQIDIAHVDRKRPVNDTGELAMELEMLSKLHKEGIINDFEYQKAKKHLLDRIQ